MIRSLAVSGGVLLLMFGGAGCSPKKKEGPLKCVINEECAQGFRCSNGLCVDIYFPALLPPQNASG